MERDERKERQRHEVMDEEQIKLANKYMDFYRQSWRDKDMRGLFAKWEEIELYWEGEAHEPKGENDPNSNTNIIHPNVEGQVALLIEQNMEIIAHPETPSDAPFAESVTHVLNWIRRKNKMKRKLEVHERRRKKFGTGIFRVLFNPDALDGFGLPEIEPVNPAYVFIDPTITDIYDVQNARFIIETTNKSIEWARKQFGDELAGAIQPNYEPVEHQYIFGEDEGEKAVTSQDSYIHMFVWTKEEDEDGIEKVRLVQMSADGIILYDSFEDKETITIEDEDETIEITEDNVIFPKNKYPYFFTPLYYREGTVWAKGSAELLIDLQNMIDDFDDQIRRNARLTGNIQKVVGERSGIDISKWTNEEGLNVPADDPREWMMVIPPQMPSYIFERRRFAFENERQVVSRFPDFMFGRNAPGVDTATEALALQQSGSAAIQHEKLMLEETLSEVFEYCLDLIKEYWTEEHAFRITDKQNDFIWFRGSALKEVEVLIPASDRYRERLRRDFPNAENIPELEPLMETVMDGDIPISQPVTKEAEFDVQVTVGAGLPNNKAFVYQAIKEAAQEGAISREEYRQLLREFVHLPIPEQVPPEIMQQVPARGQRPEMPLQGAEIEGLTPGGNVSQRQLQENIRALVGEV